MRDTGTAGPAPRPARPPGRSRTSFLLAGVWLLLAGLHLLPGRGETTLGLVLLVVELALFVVYLLRGLRQRRAGA